MFIFGIIQFVCIKITIHLLYCLRFKISSNCKFPKYINIINDYYWSIWNSQTKFEFTMNFNIYTILYIMISTQADSELYSRIRICIHTNNHTQPCMFYKISNLHLHKFQFNSNLIAFIGIRIHTLDINNKHNTEYLFSI